MEKKQRSGEPLSALHDPLLIFFISLFVTIIIIINFTFIYAFDIIIYTKSRDTYHIDKNKTLFQINKLFTYIFFIFTK